MLKNSEGNAETNQEKREHTYTRKSTWDQIPLITDNTHTDKGTFNGGNESYTHTKENKEKSKGFSLLHCFFKDSILFPPNTKRKGQTSTRTDKPNQTIHANSTRHKSRIERRGEKRQEERYLFVELEDERRMVKKGLSRDDGGEGKGAITTNASYCHSGSASQLLRLFSHADRSGRSFRSLIILIISVVSRVSLVFRGVSWHSRRLQRTATTTTAAWRGWRAIWTSTKRWVWGVGRSEARRGFDEGSNARRGGRRRWRTRRRWGDSSSRGGHHVGLWSRGGGGSGDELPAFTADPSTTAWNRAAGGLMKDSCGVGVTGTQGCGGSDGGGTWWTAVRGCTDPSVDIDETPRFVVASADKKSMI